ARRVPSPTKVKSGRRKNFRAAPAPRRPSVRNFLRDRDAEPASSRCHRRDSGFGAAKARLIFWWGERLSRRSQAEADPREPGRFLVTARQEPRPTDWTCWPTDFQILRRFRDTRPNGILRRS